MLSARQQTIIIGTMLGDGCLEKNGTHFRLKVDHGPAQQQYVNWKFDQLADVAASPPKKVEFFDQRTYKTYVHWRFATRSIKELDYFGDIFYNGGRKFIPLNVIDILKEQLALAVWYMDDGYLRRDCGALYLNTQGYKKNEQFLLKECLSNNFRIETTIHLAREHFLVYIPSHQAKKFCDIIRPHVISSMSYKLL